MGIGQKAKVTNLDTAKMQLNKNWEAQKNDREH